MATAAKILGVAPASISKICGVAKASIKYVSGVTVAPPPSSLIDSYPESNYLGYVGMNSTSNTACGQALTLSTAKVLTSCKFYLGKDGSPTGDITASIYAATGTVGSSAVPTGSPLVTSGAISASTLSTSPSLVEFTFSYSAAASDLCVVVNYNGGDSGNFVFCGSDVDSPTHTGNRVYKNGAGTWTASSTADAIFYLYGY